MYGSKCCASTKSIHKSKGLWLRVLLNRDTNSLLAVLTLELLHILGPDLLSTSLLLWSVETLKVIISQWCALTWMFGITVCVALHEVLPHVEAATCTS